MTAHQEPESIPRQPGARTECCWSSEGLEREQHVQYLEIFAGRALLVGYRKGRKSCPVLVIVIYPKFAEAMLGVRSGGEGK